MPFWQDADGSLWEAEGSFARYVDSLAPYFNEVILSVPVFDRPPASGSRVTATNVRLAPLPYFPGPRQFYPMLPAVRARLRAWVDQCDLIHLRVPTPAAIFAFRMAQAQRKPVFLLVVGDYEALLPHLPYRGIKRTLFNAYVAFEEWALRYMTTRALTFANGASLREKHQGQRPRGAGQSEIAATVHETKTTTLGAADIATRTDTCQSAPVRLLTVSRIDPRKGLRALPAAIATLVAAGRDVTLDIVGPTIGQIGESEAAAIRDDADRLGVGNRVTLCGPVPLDQLLPLYRDYDVFVLPTMPGEGIPRVLMEAMAAGLPVISTAVSGIRGLISHGENGLLIESADSSPRSSASSVSSAAPLVEPVSSVADAVSLVIGDSALRQRLIQGGYRTARAHTLDRQAADMMAVVSRTLGVTLAGAPQPA